MKDYKTVPAIRLKDGEYGCNYGKSAPRVLIRHGEFELWWNHAGSHWSGGSGMVRNETKLEVVKISHDARYPEDIRCSRHKTVVVLSEGGRVSRKLVEGLAGRIGSAMGLEEEEVKEVTGLFTEVSPVTVIF